jgi:uncharacterized protein YkwD
MVLAKQLFLISLTMHLQSKAQTTDDTLHLALLQQYALKEINILRSRAAGAPLLVTPCLQQTAQYHVIYMMQQQVLSHEESDTTMETVYDRISHHCGNKFSLKGENIMYKTILRIQALKNGKPDEAAYRAEARSIAQIWYKSHGHRRNMLDRKYRSTGLAFAFDVERERLYGVQVFGAK